MLALDWNQHLADCVAFTRRLVQTPSMPFQEAPVARLITAEMARLGFDEVWDDAAGNVSGRIYGRDRSLGALVLNAHTDHVDPGDPDLWPTPPFAAEIVDGHIVGRATADIKGPLAVQVYAMAAFKRAGQRPRRDVIFCGVVEEELGGAGAAHWLTELNYPVALVVLAEPSSNEIALGHRGVSQLWVTFPGRSVHASVPHKGVNPNYALATFLSRLPGEVARLATHPVLGPTTVAPTIVAVDTSSQNVTPAWTRVCLDVRTAVESPNSLRALVGRVAQDLEYELADALAARDACEPLAASDEIISGFYTPPDSEIVRWAQTAIERGMGRKPGLTHYQFATDGRYFAAAGMAVIGFSPADEDQAHVAGERISIAAMEEGLRGYVGLLQDF